MSTELLDRTLRADGVSEVEPEQVARFLLLGVPPSKLRVTYENEEIEQLNTQVKAEDQILLAGGDEEVDLDWQLPQRYQVLDIDEYVAEQFEARCPVDYTPAQLSSALDRIAAELEEVKKRDMTQFMRTIIYVLDELRKHSVVWGVGRGSSCASYILFILGLHVVDCVKMNVSMDEFYHE